MRETQADRENRMLNKAREFVEASISSAESSGNTSKLPYFNHIARRIVEPLAIVIKHDSDKETHSKRPAAYKKFSRYLGSLDASVVALRAVKTALSALLKAGGHTAPQPIAKFMQQSLGIMAYSEYLSQHYAQVSPPLFATIMREFGKSFTVDERQVMRSLRETFTNSGYTQPLWEFGDREAVGAYLLRRLVALGLLDLQFRAERKGKTMTTVGYVSLSEEYKASIEMITEFALESLSIGGPLVEPPLDWDYNTNSGGGYHTPEGRRGRPFAVKGHGPRRTSEVLIRSLNYLQQIAWVVNARVLSAVREASLHYDFGQVVSPGTSDPVPFPEDPSDEEKAAWKAGMREWYTDKRVRGIHHIKSRKMFEEAEELVGYPSIWFAYNADSRGRKYTRSSGIGPQGNDLGKGLIMLAKGEPLDSPEAEWWFTIHGANKYGVDKVDLDARKAWVLEHEQAILMAASDPLNSDFWRAADCPVQFLAWCMEYSDWKKYGKAFLSHLPLGQDGTCNGLQNYSALFRDEVGGYATNLVPGDSPRDIYAIVAERTLESLAAAPDSPGRTSWMSHGVTRKVTKRTTMTLPYGATRYAASEFIRKDYIEVVRPKEIPLVMYGDAAKYLSHHVWDAIGRTVIKAQEAMEWLKGWAKHCVETGQTVQWVTPTGLTVKSEYNKMVKTKIECRAFIQNRLVLYKQTDDIDLRKVQFAIAPNFIHSLDASHLDMVIAACEAEGIPIVAIHDDFGTTARHTQRLHEIIREQFVRMYTEFDIIGDMARSVGYEVPPPTPGSLDLELVKQSTYFFA